jgi:putative pyrroloquinoline-quinone-binding quinoprotein
MRSSLRRVRFYRALCAGRKYPARSHCSGTPPGKTCTPLWTGATGNEISSTPAVADGAVYVGSQDGKLYAFSAAGTTGCSGASPNKTCAALWTGASSSNFTYASPAVANGIVYEGQFGGPFLSAYKLP